MKNTALHLTHTNINTDSHTVCSLLFLYFSPTTGEDPDSQLGVIRHCDLQHFTRTPSSNISLAVNADSCQGHTYDQPRQGRRVKQMHKSEQTPCAYTDVATCHKHTHTATHKNFPQHAHPLFDRSRPQIELICIFKRRLGF